MLYGNLRIIVTGAIAALAVAAPVAQAKQQSSTGTSSVSVCNQATHNSLGGTLNADDGDKGGPARYQSNLKAKPGHGGGLVNAAANSRALTLCSEPTTPPRRRWRRRRHDGLTEAEGCPSRSGGRGGRTALAHSRAAATPAGVTVIVPVLKNPSPPSLTSPVIGCVPPA